LKPNFFVFLRIFVGLSLVFVIFKLIPYQELIDHLKKTNLYILGLAFSLFFSTHLLGVLRWKVILKTLNLNVKFKELFFLFFSGLFLNLIFPSLIAQDIFRGGLLSYKQPDSLRKITASLVIDRFSGFLALTLIVLASFSLGGRLVRNRVITFSVLILTILMLFSLLFIGSRQFFRMFLVFLGKAERLKERLTDFHNCLYVFRKKPFSFLKIFSISLIIQSLGVVVFYIVGLSFGLRVNFLFYFILIPIVMVVANLPLTSAGLGTREFTMVYFFSKIGVEKSLALGISLANFFFIVILGLLGGVLYVTFYSRRLQSYKQNS